MLNLFFYYILTGCFVSFLVYKKVSDMGYTGERIVSFFDDDLRIKCKNNPNLYRYAMYLMFLVIVFIWPYVLYKMLNKE